MARTSARARKTPGKAVVKPSTIGGSSNTRKKVFTIYIDDDDTPPPEAGLGTASKVAKPLASSSDYGGSSDNEDLVAAAGQVELMRSWVDCGIEIAIKEIQDEKLGIFKEDYEPRSTSGQSLQSPFTGTNPPPQTPTPRMYEDNTSYATPSQSRSSYAQHYNSVPQYQSMGTPQGYQYYPAAAMPPQSRGYYTPQHGMAYTPQSGLQNPSQYPPQSYYATPPTSQPPFLQSPAPFSSSALPQSSPTPLPHGMTAFHSGSIPQSSGMPHAYRHPLAPGPSNIQARVSSMKSTSADKPYVLPPGQYLSWYKLEYFYGPARQKFPNDDSYKAARLDWVKTIKMDERPFNQLWVAEYKKEEVEASWAGLPATKRNHVEMHALAYRYRAVIQAPYRDVPHEALPMSFMSLETQFFNIPEGKLANSSDTMRQRTSWLIDLGLIESSYHGLCNTLEQQIALETEYSKLSVVKRRSIEARARFLKVKLNPPEPMFREFEEQHSIYKKRDFSCTIDYKDKRREWLRVLGIDEEPFFYLPYDTTEVGIAQYEKTEVAWNDLGLARRQAIEDKATEFKKAHTWGLSWGDIETRIGFVPSDGERYTQWLTSIGMGRALKSNETRDSVWLTKSEATRQAIYQLAITERKEIQDRWDARQGPLAMKASTAKAPKKYARASKIGKSGNTPRGFGDDGRSRRRYGRGRK